MRRLSTLLVLSLLGLAACGEGGGGGGGGPDGGSDGGSRTYQYRALAGVSMGAIGTGLLGTREPGVFDALGPLGGSLDLRYFLHYFEDHPLSGFCTYEDTLAILQAAGGDPEALNDIAAIEACAVRAPATERFEHAMDFNHWWYDDNGGTFDRSSYIDLLEDVSQALGNPAFHNPENPFFPPGVDESATCADPIVFPGTDHGGDAPVYNDRFNPEGRFDVITFCDGEEPIVTCEQTGQVVDFCAGVDPDTFCGADGPAVQLPKNRLKAQYPEVYYREKGSFDPCRPHSERLRVVLAVDYDGDGVRDYGEPVIVNGRERWEDTGADGCPSTEEDGAGGCTTAAESPHDPVTNPDPNGDDHDWERNALGTEGDWVWQEGEPFTDAGLDGVAGTGDHGEGNGRYDLSDGAARWLTVGPRSQLERWSDEELANTDFWFDGGIRDIFNLGVSAAQTYGHVAARDPQSLFIQNFPEVPTYDDVPVDPFDFREVDWARIPGKVLFLYGDPDATDAQWRDGDGAHVGTVKQVLDRMNLLFAWLSERFPEGDDSGDDFGSYSELVLDESYYSEALGSDRVYSRALPPGYFDPANAERSYPVVYFLHGYGQDPTGMSGANVVLTGYMAEALLEKMIVVYVDGRCCFRNAAGERDCHEPADAPDKGPGWVRECHRGSFYVDSQGKAAGEGTAYGASLDELMAHIEATYRVKAPATR
ncbi:MAG: hypothetical protein P1V51_06080 [Deltaproteobacteria bacterium]|nr:hypothetical protein [Deltaproteobacteria bacterium]